MKINDLKINNWSSPGDIWWEDVQSVPDEPRIETTISMTLSFSEYKELIDRSKKAALDNLSPRITLPA